MRCVGWLYARHIAPSRNTGRGFLMINERKQIYVWLFSFKDEEASEEVFE